MITRIQCNSPACGALFEVATERLGRNVYCVECGHRITAKPIALPEQLARRRRELTESVGASMRRLPLAALLADIRSLWNVGSMFRTADACGVAKLYLAGITGSPPRAEITKTALGAEDLVAWEYHESATSALDSARAAGFVPVGLEHTPDAEPIGEFEWPPRVCLVLGNEVVGVAPALMKGCERKVYIPMRGVKESLNVAVAFGIAAHAAAGTFRKT